MQKNKHSIKGIFLLLFMGFIWSGSHAQDAYRPMNEVAAFKKQMVEASVQTNSISSDFVQLKHLSFLEEDVESKGSFFFQKEHKLRWEYSSPFHYLIIFKNDSILIQDESNSNLYDASSGRMFREINAIMMSMVNGSILESRNFEFEYFENAGGYKLELKPLEVNMREFLSGIHLFINKNDHSVDELQMIEKSGDYTHIRFINKRLNEDIPQHTFNLH